MTVSLKELTLLRRDALINGEWQKAEDDSRFSIFNPANGASIAEVAKCGSREAHAAIDAAYHALAPWQALSAKARSKYLYRLYELVIAHRDELALILTLEQGKPLAEAKGEVEYGADYILWFAEEAKRVYGDTIPAPLC